MKIPERSLNDDLILLVTCSDYGSESLKCFKDKRALAYFGMNLQQKLL